MRSMLRSILVGVILAPLLGMSGSSNVTIQNMQFQPATIQIDVGESVTWTNADDRDHKLNFAKGPSSPNLKPGKSWSRSFPEAGSFAYSCEYRPRMKGTVVVK